MLERAEPQLVIVETTGQLSMHELDDLCQPVDCPVDPVDLPIQRVDLSIEHVDAFTEKILPFGHEPDRVSQALGEDTEVPLDLFDCFAIHVSLRECEL
jgi:hypothetical protein